MAGACTLAEAKRVVKRHDVKKAAPKVAAKMKAQANKTATAAKNGMTAGGKAATFMRAQKEAAERKKFAERVGKLKPDDLAVKVLKQIMAHNP
jgi:hypothetical protein